MNSSAARDKVSAEPCRCVSCGDCGGSGDMRSLRYHDMDEAEACDTCGGSGIAETCYRCQLLEEMDDDH